MKYEKHNAEIRSLIANGYTKNGAAKEISVRYYAGENYKGIMYHIQCGNHLLDIDLSTSNKVEAKETVVYKGDSAVYDYDGPEVIDSLPKALAKSGVDLNDWEVSEQQFSTNTVTMKLKTKIGQDKDGRDVYEDKPSQHTNYVCRLKFAKKDHTYKELYDFLKESLSEDIKEVDPVSVTKGSSVGVVHITDLHIGAEIKDLMRTPDFNIRIVRDKLMAVADKVNDLNYDAIHLCMLGDYVESITGLNHLNTWRSLGDGMHGANVIKIAFELIRDCLLLRIKNLIGVNIVSGNHDRFTMSSAVDNEGQAGSMLSYLISISVPGIYVNFNSMILVKEIDGIEYFLTHGDKRLASKPVKLIQDYHQTNNYAVVVAGHLHTRKVKKTLIRKVIEYFDIDVVGWDEIRYRMITAPSIFTGNYWSEGCGFGGTSGFVVTHREGDSIRHIDIPV